MRRKWLIALLVLFTSGCAGLQRSCASWSAENFASDWIVVQYDQTGRPFNCWKLTNTSITNETNSDGVYWQDRSRGHLVHLAGWYNRVQVSNNDFDGAARLVGVLASQCTDGIYPTPSERQ